MKRRRRNQAKNEKREEEKTNAKGSLSTMLLLLVASFLVTGAEEAEQVVTADQIKVVNVRMPAGKSVVVHFSFRDVSDDGK